MKKGDFTCELMGLVRNSTPDQDEPILDDSQLKLDLDMPEDDVIPLLPNRIGLDLWSLLYDFYEIDGGKRMGIRTELSCPISYNNKNVVNTLSTCSIVAPHQPDPIVQNSDIP